MKAFITLGLAIASIMMVSHTAFTTTALAEPLEISASQELIWDQTKGVYIAQGDAKAIRGVQALSAAVLTAYYDTESDDQDVTRIVADKNVSFTDADMSGSGQLLDYNVVTDFYQLDGPKARITSKDGKIRAEKTVIFDRKNGLIFAQEKGEILLSDGRLLRGEMIEITLSDTEEIQTVDATGNVYVRQQDGKEAYSQEGQYNAETGKAILIGDVKIIDGESILNGQKAEIDFNNGISKLIADQENGRVSGTLATSD